VILKEKPLRRMGGNFKSSFSEEEKKEAYEWVQAGYNVEAFEREEPSKRLSKEQNEPTELEKIMKENAQLQAQIATREEK
jgi:hypothetical protein